MTIIDLRNVGVIERDSGSVTLRFEVFFDQPPTSTISFHYFTTDGTASGATPRDFYHSSGTRTVSAGTERAYIDITVYGDNAIEGDESFQLFVIAGQNTSLAGGAAALRATGTIYDNDDNIPDFVPTIQPLAERIYGPTSEHDILPTIGVRNVSLAEGDSSSEAARFLIVSLGVV